MKYLVSAGHGGTDPGAVAHGHREADICLDMRDRVAKRLVELRHESELFAGLADTRCRSAVVPLSAAQDVVLTDGEAGTNKPLRDALALVPKVSVAVELHCNAGPATATGVEVVALERDKRLAQRIAKAIAGATGQRLRGQAGWIPQEHTARGQLAFVQAGGLVVEMVFMTNHTDLVHFLNARQAVADAIAAALCGNEVGT